MPGSQYVGTSRNKHKPSENKTARDLGKRAVTLIRLLSRFVRNQANREFKIRRLRTTTTDKHATMHDQNHVIVRFSRVVLRLR